MTIYGTDMSHYDAAPANLGARLVAEGFTFATHKAGGDKVDPELAAWWTAVRGQRDQLLLGAYWVLYPGNPVSRANAFLNRLDDQCPGWDDGPFVLQLDCEIWGGDKSTRPGEADIRAACNQLKHEHPKLTPVVYASKGQYGDSLSGLGYPLWNANYPSSMTGAASAIYDHVGGDSGPGWHTYSGQVPAIWQFTSSATIAGQTTCDANAYRGTLAELTTLVAPGWEVDDVELTDKYGDEAWPGRTVQNRLKDDAGLRDVLWGDGPGTKAAALSPTSPLARLIAVPDQLAKLTAALTALAGKDLVDEQAIVAGVLAGLDPAKIAAAIPADMAAQVADILARRLAA